MGNNIFRYLKKFFLKILIKKADIRTEILTRDICNVIQVGRVIHSTLTLSSGMWDFRKTTRGDRKIILGTGTFEIKHRRTISWTLRLSSGPWDVRDKTKWDYPLDPKINVGTVGRSE